jgi:YD repeat-containing protein
MRLTGPAPRAIKTLLAVATAVLILHSLPAQEGELYRSNEEFLPIEAIGEAERGEYRWVMRVVESGRSTERELYRHGELYRLRTETVGPEGLPQEVRTLDAEGTLLESRRYRYDNRRRLRAVEVEGADEDSRFLSGEVSQGPGEHEEALQELEDGERARSVYRYDELGRLVRRTRYLEDSIVEQVEQEYASGVLRLRTRVYPLRRRREIIRYSEDGLPVEEELYEAQRLTRRIERSYSEEGRLLRELIEGRESREFRYAYGDDGAILEEEEYLNGTILKRIRYEEDDRRVEIQFRRGEAFLRTYYDDDRRIREELLRNGRIVEIRRFEEGESNEE